MKQRIRRLTALILALSISLSLLSANVWAEELQEVVEATESISTESVELEQSDTEEEVIEEDSSEEQDTVTEVKKETVEEEEVIEDDASEIVTADTTISSGDWTYRIANGTATIYSYSGHSSSVTIPTRATLNGSNYIIRSVDSSAFEGNTSIQSVVIPADINYLGKKAFKNCVNLSSITINGNLGDCSSDSANIHYDYSASVFYGAGINTDGMTVTFGNSVTYIPEYLFATGHSKSDNVYANIKTINFSNSITKIGAYAFYCCYGIDSLTFSDSITEIEKDAFCCCESITSINWSKNSNLKKIGEDSFAYISGIKSLTLPQKLISIGTGSFAYCKNIESVEIPKSTTAIGKRAFKYCTNLASITINGNLGDCSSDSANIHYDYSDSVFYGAGINTDGMTVTFGNSVTYIPAYLFATGHDKSENVYANMSKVIIPESVSEIGKCAFYRCYSLKDVEIKSKYTYFNDYCFSGVDDEIIFKCYRDSSAEYFAWNHGYDIDCYPSPNIITASGKTFMVNDSAVQTWNIGAEVLDNAPLNYESDNSSITVDQNGKVSIAKGYVGKAIITITCAETKNYTAVAKEITIAVYRPNTITASSKTFTANASTALTWSISAKVKDKAKLSYKSDNKSITVDSKGKVTVKKGYVGKATITITAAATKNYAKTTKKVTVTVSKAKQPMVVTPTAKTYKLADVKKKAQTLTLKVTKAQGAVTYKSSNTKYVTVSKGKVSIKKGTPKGTYKITVTAAGKGIYDKGSKTVTITVK